MAISNVVKVRRDGTIAIADNSGFGGANVLTIAYENGDFSYEHSKADRIVIRDRGVIAGLRQGDDPVPTLTFTVHAREFTNGTVTTIIDVIMRTGGAAAWTSSGPTGYEQFLVDCRLTVEGTDFTDSADGTAVFADVLLTYSYAEGDPNTISVSGEVYGAITRTGQA
mgnify:CR=1 FL=1